jgi:predicted Zn finger-like uncharacterized protein
MRLASLILVLIFVVALIGCTTEEKSALTGAAIGTAAGAIIGHQSGSTAQGALIGGTAGLIGGYLYGKHRTKTNAEGKVEKLVECPKCNTTLQLAESAAAGQKIQCGSCKTTFILQ